MADEQNTGTEPQATTLSIEIPHSAPEGSTENRSVTIDLAAIPADARLELLKARVKESVINRVNVANVRANKARAPFIAWATYDGAIAADPMQTLVPKPDGERPTGEAPAALDTYAKATEAVEALLKGELGQSRTPGGAKSRAPKDPLIAAVTNVVTRAVFDSQKAAGTTIAVEGKPNRAYTYPDAVKAVGGDGVAYLNAQIDAKVAAVPEAEQAALRKQLETQRDTRYIEPAKIMLGQSVSKKSADLPSIL